MIVPARTRMEDGTRWHYVKAGGGKTRASICGKAVHRAKSGWFLGKGTGKPCDECIAIARRKYGVAA